MENLELTDKIVSVIGTQNKPMNLYSLGEKISYLSMIASLAWAEGSIDEAELQNINAIAKRAGITDKRMINAVIANTEKYDSGKYTRWTEILKKTDLKYSLMTDMFLTAFADNVVRDSEAVYLKYLAGKLNISTEMFNKIRNVTEKIKTANKNVKIEYEKNVYYSQKFNNHDISQCLVSKGLKPTKA